MKNLRNNVATSLLALSMGLLASTTGFAKDYWLVAKPTTILVPDGVNQQNAPKSRPVVMWGFGLDPDHYPAPTPVTVPGPAIQLDESDGTLTIHLSNYLPEPLSLVIPGQFGFVRAAAPTPEPVVHPDGPYADRMRSLVHEAAASDGTHPTTADYIWNNVTSGTYLYHSGSHPAVQVQMGLYGAMTKSGLGDAYSGVLFDQQTTLVFSEIDPDVHDSVAVKALGSGPRFTPFDFPVDPSNPVLDNLIAALNPGGTLPPVVSLVLEGLSPNDATLLASASADPEVRAQQAAALSIQLNAVIMGASIYNPVDWPETSLSAATQAALSSNPQKNEPETGAPFHIDLVRLNRLLLQDSVLGSVLPPLPTMTSTIRSSPRYFLVNGAPFTPSSSPLVVGSSGETILLRLLNAGIDMHVPTLDNGGDLQIVAEDGQLLPAPRSSYSVMMPALKTADVLWTPPAAPGVYTLYDRRLGLSGPSDAISGMYAQLKVTPPVLVAPKIVSEPADVTVLDGASASFQVGVTGTKPLSYQWSRDGQPIPGETGPSLTLPVVTLSDGGAHFSVHVSNGVAPDADSRSALLTVNPAPPTITGQPQSITVADGSPASFTVVATGTAPLHYQWYRGALPVSGATGPTLSLPTTVWAVDNGAVFTVRVSNGVSPDAISNPATLTVTPIAPHIITQPSNITVEDGQPASFTVVVAGTQPLTYQWYRRFGTTPATYTYTAVTAAPGISGMTSPTLSFNPATRLMNGRVYQVRISGPGGGPVRSVDVTLNVLVAPPRIVTQPVSVTRPVAQDAQFVVTASGTGPLSYQWYRNGVAISNGGGYQGANSRQLQIGAVTFATAGTFTVKVTGPFGQTVTSSPATLSVTGTITRTGQIQVPSPNISGMGAADVFPAPITVPNVSGNLQRISVTLNGLAHQRPHDVEAILVSPHGEHVRLMSAVGPATGGSTLNNSVTLTFSDGGASISKGPGTITSGTYDPTAANILSQPLNPPAGTPASPYTTTLSSCVGFNPSGQWRLYVWDDTSSLTGRVGSWSMNITVGP